MSLSRQSLLAVTVTVWLATGGVAQANDCTIDYVSGVAFGAFNPIANTPGTSAGSIQLCCTGPGPTYYLTVDLDGGGSSNASARTMSSMDTSDLLAYNLYLDSAYTQIWGDGTNGTAHYGPSALATNSCTTLNVHGYMPAHQAVAAGSYSDTLTVTLSF